MTASCSARSDPANAVFDLDVGTLDDPLIDLGILLHYRADSADTPEDQPITLPELDALGLPSRDDVCEGYASSTRLDLGAISWYEAFARFNMAAVLQQLYIRCDRGESIDHRVQESGSWGHPMARRAARVLGMADS